MNELQYDARLNSEQRAAIYSEARNTVVIAGPGTGKTACLVERVIRRFSITAGPCKVAAITYTIAAAAELRARLKERCGFLKPEDELFIGTIHALALSLLRGPWAKFLPCPEPLTVMTQERNKRAVVGSKTKMRYTGTQKLVDLELEAASWLCAGADEYLPSGLPAPGRLNNGTPATNVARAYFQSCRKNSLISYDDLIKTAVELCHRGGTLEPTGDFFDELLVDEYQDASEYTEAFIAALTARNRFVIGDQNQSIFGFLGGSPYRMTQLSTLNPLWTAFLLTQSYRCSAPVAAAANRLISFQSGPRLPEMLPAPPHPMGGVARAWTDFETAADEMWQVSETLKGLMDGPGCNETFAVLARTNFIVGQFAEYLQSKGIPVVQSDKAGLPENWELILAAAAMIDQPHNDALVYDVVCQINSPANADKLRDAAILADQPMMSLLPHGMPPAAKNAAEAVVALESFVASVPGIDPRALPLIHRALERVGPDATVAELRLALNDPGLKERDHVDGSVDVTTIHSFKGREADHVFIVGCNEGILPGRGAESEERRLMFVAITRARISCTMTCARERLMGAWSSGPQKAEPSRYIAEAMGKGGCE